MALYILTFTFLDSRHNVDSFLSTNTDNYERSPINTGEIISEVWSTFRLKYYFRSSYVYFK
jgi:hypothetical protein